MANETDAVVTHCINVAAFLWSPAYGDVFQPISRARHLLPDPTAPMVDATKVMPVGTWLRVAVSPQQKKNNHHWVSDARHILPPDPNDPLFQAFRSSQGAMEIEGVGVVGMSQGGEGLIWNPRVGRILFKQDALSGGNKLPPPLVHVSFRARDRGKVANPDMIKFRAHSVKPYNGRKLEYGVEILRCLGRDSLEIGAGVLGFVVEGEPEKRVRVDRWVVAGEEAGALDDIQSKAFMVYAVPRPYATVDTPGAKRGCEWDAICVKLDGKRPPAPLPTPTPQSQPQPQPLQPQLQPEPNEAQVRAYFRPTANLSSNSPSPRTSPPAAAGKLHSAASTSRISDPFSPDISVDEEDLAAEAAESEAQTHQRDRWSIRTELIEAALEDEAILAILSDKYGDILMEYLSIAS